MPRSIKELSNKLSDMHIKHAKLTLELARAYRIIAVWPSAFKYGACSIRTKDGPHHLLGSGVITAHIADNRGNTYALSKEELAAIGGYDIHPKYQVSEENA